MGIRTPDRQVINTHQRNLPHRPRRRRMISRKLSTTSPPTLFHEKKKKSITALRLASNNRISIPECLQ